MPGTTLNRAPVNSTTIGRIVVFGGGRWARVLIHVLRQVLPEETAILWVSRHSYESAENWLQQNLIANLQLVRNVDLASSAADAVIVATAPESHCKLTQQAVALGLPTLCEKPLAADLSQARELLRLSQSSGCPLGIHLEFLYAGYLHDFAQLIRGKPLSSIHIEWQDPWCEERGAESKFAEFYTDVMNDQLPHCWSVLSVILPKKAELRISELRETPAGADVIGQFGGVEVTCSLGRRADHRMRRVSVNRGEWRLDFSQEPGVSVHRGLATGNTWSGERPLNSSLKGFLEVVWSPERQHAWPLSLTNCFDSVQCSLSASMMWKTLLDKRLQDLQQQSTFDPENPEHIRLVIDRFLPEFAERGQRCPVRTFEEQKAFVKTWMSHPE